MKYFVETVTNSQIEIDEWSYEKLFRNAGPNTNICFNEKMRNGTRKVCLPVRNILYFYSIEENYDNKIKEEVKVL